MDLLRSDTVRSKNVTADLERKFRNKFDDQLLIIEKQRDRLDKQQEQLNYQRSIIEELAWQIRDLRDSVRKCSEQIKCLKHVECRESGLKLHIPRVNEPERSTCPTGVSPIYESINFDATPAPYLRASHQIKANKLRRQDAFDDSAQNERNRGSSRDIRSFFNSCIPPPPAESPPSVKDPDDKHDPVEISSNTLEKLNSLYSAYKLNRSVSNESDELNDVVYRLREFNDFSSRRYRGSSKAMCSLVSNVEESYLPHLDDEKSRFSHFTTDQIIQNIKRPNDKEMPANSSLTKNDEVYI